MNEPMIELINELMIELISELISEPIWALKYTIITIG